MAISVNVIHIFKALFIYVSGVFYLRQVLGAKGVFEPCPMHRKVKPYVTLERMGGWLKEIMAKLLIDLVTVKRLVVLPGDAGNAITMTT